MKSRPFLLFLGVVGLVAIGSLLFTMSQPGLPAAISFGIGEPDVETKPARYPALLAEWSARGLVAHFPKAIPQEATNVRFSSFPGFMQGGAWLQIRFNLLPHQVAAIFTDAAKRAKTFYDGGDIFELVNEKEGGLAGTSFHTSGTDEVSFPDDYRVFIFSARDAGSPSANWNHGDSTGIVVSQKRNEVVYFAESW